jgi:hypothetical protein
MRKIIILVMAIFLTFNLFAIKQNLSSAQKVAQTKLELNNNSDFSINQITEIKDENGNVLAYLFNLSPKGFILVSNDSDIMPIIGYSFRNNFSTKNSSLNNGLYFVKQNMELQNKAISLMKSDVKAKANAMWKHYLNNEQNFFNSRERSIYPPEGYSSTGGWIDAQWNQQFPWNQYCPMDPENGGRSYTGCVATAMAQILYYHRFVGDATFNDSDDYTSNYTTPYIHIDDDWNSCDFPNFPTLNSYLDDVRAAFAGTTPFTDEMMATMSFACGVATDMQYSSSDGSGTQTSKVYTALHQKFDFDTAIYKYGSASNFYTLLNGDMLAGRPAELGIIEQGAPYGHAIVCDGYNSADDTYHLNMGWAGSSDGWYTLPSGMPAGFNVITAGVLNIEGGTLPFTLYGNTNVDGTNISATISLDGVRHFSATSDNNGSFTIPFCHSGTYNLTAQVELENGGYYYVQQEVVIDENSPTLIVNLNDYSQITGTVSADVPVENTNIRIFNENYELLRSAIADANGNFTLPGLLDGTYKVQASLDGNYFGEETFNLTYENQNIALSLNHYSYPIHFGFHSEATDTFGLPLDISCAIKLAGDDIADFNGSILNRVRFIAPLNPEDCELTAQLWIENTLISEVPVSNFSAGEWVDITFDNYLPIAPDETYYVGYKVHKLGSDNTKAYHDAGPRIANKGAFYHTTSWSELPSSFDYNLCIDAYAGSSVVVSNSGHNDVNASSLLKQNYPNPFNASVSERGIGTNIAFNISKNDAASNVELSIFNIKGQLVKTLLDDKLSAGKHVVNWNGKNTRNEVVTSGVYFYKLKTENTVQVNKMLLMK